MFITRGNTRLTEHYSQTATMPTAAAGRKHLEPLFDFSEKYINYKQPILKECKGKSIEGNSITIFSPHIGSIKDSFLVLIK